MRMGIGVRIKGGLVGFICHWHIWVLYGVRASLYYCLCCASKNEAYILRSSYIYLY